MKIKLQELKDKVAEGDDVQAIVGTLLYAEMHGNNQGTPEIATGGAPKASSAEEPSVVKRNNA